MLMEEDNALEQPEYLESEQVATNIVEENDNITAALEAQASLLGWKKDYNGKSPHLNAKEYFAKIAEEIPKLRSLRNDAQKYEKNIDILIKHQQLERKHQERQLEKERLQMQKEFTMRHQEAVDNGDYIAARQIIKDEAQYEKEYTEIKERLTDNTIENTSSSLKNHPRQFTQEEHEVTADWIGKNPWYNENPVLRNAVTEYFVTFYNNKKLDIKSAIAEAEKATRKSYPQWFDDADIAPKTSNSNRMISTGNINRNAVNLTGWDKLTPEAKQEFTVVNDMLARMKAKPLTKEAFLETCKNEPEKWHK